MTSASPPLERLARYGARGPVAEARLRRLEEGQELHDRLLPLGLVSRFVLLLLSLALAAITLYAAMSLGITETLKRKVTLNRAQHRLLRGNVVALAAFIGFWALSWWLGVAFGQALVLFMFLVSALWAAAGALFDVRGLTMGVAFLVGAVLAAALPQWQLEVFGLTTLVGFSALGVAWRRWRGGR